MRYKKIIVLSGILLFATGNSMAVHAQKAVITGHILGIGKATLEDAVIGIKNTRYFAEAGIDGGYTIKNVPYGTYQIVCFAPGKQTVNKEVVIDKPVVEVDFLLHQSFNKELDEVIVMQQQEKSLGITRLKSVQNFTVYEGKKNEVVLLNNITANKATNNARQIYGTVTGLNIWESDGGGLQLGIGGRGLNPNRTGNFNTRQNGYDISADALGYPESYYTPAAEAIERIEIIRGAASLQYGTQFGGMVNFLLKKGKKDVRFEYTGRQTTGSWHFINSFNSVGGTSKNHKLNYYAFYQRKQGDGWRPNSHYKVNNGYFQLAYQPAYNTRITIEYTHTDYLAKQAGGLTDALFNKDPKTSIRNRNWFQINWNLLAISLTYKFSPATQLNIRNFGLQAKRQSLGNLERINVADFGQRRTLIDGSFQNAGSEIRFLHTYKGRNKNHVLLAGARIYMGNTTARQGDGDSLSGPNFVFVNPANLEGSDYQFPSYNYALFAEHIFNITDKLSITPGIRFENIQTFSEGYYRQRVYDFAGNIVADHKTNENTYRKRSFIITGIGISYKHKPALEWYGNFSQNYRAINFTDLRIQNPNFIIDSNLTDEKGFTADIGVRGSIANKISYEATAFFLYYNNRIGQVEKADQPPLYLDYRLRTNVAASRNMGIESFASINIARFGKWLPASVNWTVFINASLLDAKYLKSKERSTENKQVEMAPPFILRSGTHFTTPKWKLGFQISYVSQHFSDATNATFTSSAVEGSIPSYKVADFSASYRVRTWLGFEFSCNNIFDEKYFTRRAESYPGPGIIPSDGRSFFATIEVQLSRK